MINHTNAPADDCVFTNDAIITPNPRHVKENNNGINNKSAIFTSGWKYAPKSSNKIPFKSLFINF